MGGVDDDNGGKKSVSTVFVTVGTTSFDSLVKALDTEQVKQELFRKGYTHLLIQMGRGSYIPTTKSAEESGGVAVDYFTFSSSIADYLKSASLVISHAAVKSTIMKLIPDVDSQVDAMEGLKKFRQATDSFANLLVICARTRTHPSSGSIFETLRLGKPLIVVVNEDLMDNHQSELAEELAARKHLLCARPQTLYTTIANMNLDVLLPYPPADAKPAAYLINRFLGFPDD